MRTYCTRCESTGFLNIHQLSEEKSAELDLLGAQEFLNKNTDIIESEENDIQVCDCCGDGEGWYGIPGEHYNSDDPPGKSGPYAYNGGLCECR